MVKEPVGKTFSKILVAIYEPIKSADIAIKYATRVAEDYDSKLIILYIIRGNVNLQSISPPGHISK